MIEINNLEDLQREERRVMKRIKKHEIELVGRVKQLPEQIITVGATKVITGIVEGSALKSIVSVIKRIGKTIFSSLVKEVE